MVEKVLYECGAEERETPLKDVLEAAPRTTGRTADCRPVLCWRRSDLVAERRLRLTADMMVGRSLRSPSVANWVLKLRNSGLPGLFI